MDRLFPAPDGLPGLGGEKVIGKEEAAGNADSTEPWPHGRTSCSLGSRGLLCFLTR